MSMRVSMSFEGRSLDEIEEHGYGIFCDSFNKALINML